jgi:hypothetical protein
MTQTLPSAQPLSILSDQAASDQAAVPQSHHYVLTLNPSAPAEHQRLKLNDPLTYNRPDLADLVANAIAQVPGTHLVKVTVQVEIIQSEPIEPPGVLPACDTSWIDEHLIRESDFVIVTGNRNGSGDIEF